METRYPDFDFGDAVPHWGDNHEACTVINGGGGGDHPTADRALSDQGDATSQTSAGPVDDAELLADMGVLTKQEGQHL